MAETLAEVDSFDADIVVPDGDDWMDDAAEVVATFASKLTNRTRYFLNRAGFKANDQSWAGLNTFLKRVTVRATTRLTSALFLQRASDADDKWQLLIESQTDAAGTQRVGLYSMPYADTVGGFAIVLNAQYDPVAGWTLIDGTKPGCALIWRYSDVRYVAKPPGSPAWSSWPQNTVTAFGGTIISQALQAGNVLAVGPTNSDTGKGYRYTTSVPRTSPIPLGELWGNTQVNAFGSIARNTGITGVADQVWIPIRVAPYCGFSEVRVQLLQHQSSVPDQFQLHKRSGVDGWIAVGSAESVSGTGAVTLHLHTGVTTVVQDNEEWAYRWTVASTDPIANTNCIVGAEVDWLDAGPCNRVG